MPSRMTFPPPNFTSLPYPPFSAMRSRSTSMKSSVSARRTWSPTVGPNISAYTDRVSFISVVTVCRSRAHSGHRLPGFRRGPRVRLRGYLPARIARRFPTECAVESRAPADGQSRARCSFRKNGSGCRPESGGRPIGDNNLSHFEANIGLVRFTVSRQSDFSRDHRIGW